MISVIIPTYGSPVYLQESIESVIGQTFQNWELIIVDDNNSDTEARKATESLVEKFIYKDNRIKYIKHEKNMNGAVARNTGFTVAKGKYISLLDSDDLYLPNRLQKCYDVMENSDEKIAGVYTGCEFRKGNRKYNSFADVKSGNFLVETLACRFMFCTGSNIFVRKEVVNELNGFDVNFLRHQDYEFLVRMFLKYSLRAIPEILVVKNNENFNLPNLDKLAAIKKQYLSKFQYVIDTLPNKDVKYIMHCNYINLAENAMAQNKIKIANKFYNEASKFTHLSTREWFRRIAYLFYNLVKRY